MLMNNRTGHAFPLYYPGPRVYQHRPCYQGPDCTCPPARAPDTFLHQILTGKGYKNDCLFVNRPIKQEVYQDYSCCYGNGYPPPYPYSHQ